MRCSRSRCCILAPCRASVVLFFPTASSSSPRLAQTFQFRSARLRRNGRNHRRPKLQGRPQPAQTVLAPMALGAYQTRDLSLDNAFGLLPLPLPFCSIRIQYSGPPGSVIGEVSSIESKGDLLVDSRVTNEADWLGMSGAHPWHLDEETESVLILTNMGDKECAMGFQVQAGGVHYHLIDLRLAPHEIRAIDIRKLRDAQKADFQGNKIPAEATDGSVIWARMEDVPVTGRLVVLQRHREMASNYTCGTGCPCPTNFFSMAVTCQGDPIVVLQNDQHFATQNRVDCNQLHFYSDETNFSSWTSSYPSIATVNNSNHKGLATGVSGGTTTIIAQFTTTNYYYVPYSGCHTQPVGGAGNKSCNVVWVTLSLRSAGTLSSDNSAAPVMSSILGTNDLYTLMDTDGFWVTPVEVVGYVAPSTFTGSITIHRQLLGLTVYDTCTLTQTRGPADDSSNFLLRDDDPQSGGSAGKVYDTDEPGIEPTSSDPVNHVFHFRANFYEYATTTINGATRTVSGNLNWFSRVSYLKTSNGSQLSNDIGGDNIAGTGTTKTSCDLR